MSRKQPTPAPDPDMRPAPPPAPPIRFGTLPNGADDVRDVTMNGFPVSHVVWRPTAADPPDDDLVVLMAPADGEVWPGFKLGDQWFDIDAGPMPAPKWWCHFPEGPT